MVHLLPARPSALSADLTGVIFCLKDFSESPAPWIPDMLCHTLLYEIHLSMKKWNPSHCASEVHISSDIFKICCQLQLASNQWWQDSSVFLFCPVLVGFACTKFMHRTYMCCHSKWDETNFAHLVVNWDCANNSGLAVRWNFIVEKTLGGKKKPSAEKPQRNLSWVLLSGQQSCDF